MIADEIRMLAEDCEKEARHIDEDAGVAFSNGDLRMKEVFDTISRTERKKASALLACAAMVERCENMRANIAKHNKVFNEVWGHDDTFDGNKLIDYIMKGSTDGTH